VRFGDGSILSCLSPDPWIHSILKGFGDLMPAFRISLSIAAAAALLGGGILLAQPGEGEGSPQAETPEPAAAPSTPKMTPVEMQASADSLMKDMRVQLGRMVELRQLARQSQDVIKLNCVNDNMLLFKQVVNIAENAQTSMVEATAQDDETDRYHYYGQIVLAREKAASLGNEAEGCVGEEIIFLGPTEVEITDRPDVLDDLDSGREWFEFDDPKYATPFT
jgi:hypothetical protein